MDIGWLVVGELGFPNFEHICMDLDGFYIQY